MAELVLRCGARALVDADVWEWAQEHTWRLNTAGYVARTTQRGDRRRELRLHRLVMGEPEGLVVHHINRRKTDCRRENLEVLTAAEHSRRHREDVRRYMEDAPPRPGSPFKGVRLDRVTGRWHAAILANGRPVHLGYYDTAEAAAWAYDVAVWFYRGGRGYLNLPDYCHCPLEQSERPSDEGMPR